MCKYGGLVNIAPSLFGTTQHPCFPKDLSQMPTSLERSLTNQGGPGGLSLCIAHAECPKAWYFGLSSPWAGFTEEG